ncbi:hypothetical protein FXO38_28565 [Capsicum annuum]|nr:hypothetical protein FXO38_28565 [Capsicum annuum]
MNKSKIVEVFIQAQDEIYYQHLLPVLGKLFIEVLKNREMIEDGIKTSRIVSFATLKATSHAIKKYSRSVEVKKNEKDTSAIVVRQQAWSRKPRHRYPQAQTQDYAQAPQNHSQNPLYFIPPPLYPVYNAQPYVQPLSYPQWHALTSQSHPSTPQIYQSPYRPNFLFKPNNEIRQKSRDSFTPIKDFIEDCRALKREIEKMIQDKSIMVQNINSEGSSSMLICKVVAKMSSSAIGKSLLSLLGRIVGNILPSNQELQSINIKGCNASLIQMKEPMLMRRFGARLKSKVNKYKVKQHGEEVESHATRNVSRYLYCLSGECPKKFVRKGGRDQGPRHRAERSVGLHFSTFFDVTNSQSSLKDFRVSIENETPKLDVLARCYEDGEDPTGEYSIQPGWVAEFVTSINPGKTNTLSCDLKLEKKHGTFRMFDLKNTSICHNFGEKCHWNVHEDGACLLVKGKCVMFKWDNSLLVRHIRLDTAREHIMWKRTP